MRVLTLVLLLSLSWINPAFAEKSGVLVNNTVSLEKMNKDQALEIFLFLRKFWYLEAGGGRIIVIVPPNGSISFNKLATVELGMAPQRLYESITAKIHAGVANPLLVQEDSYVPIKVALTPFSIGYHYAAIHINTGIGIRIIKLD